jgi:steroid delta-isomerase-like uncharacterized protein
MSDQNKSIVRRASDECFNKGNMGIIDELVATDYIWHGPGQEVSGQEGIKQLTGMIRQGFPDLKFSIENQTAEGDKVAIRWTMQGTHKGEFFGVQPTGKMATFTGIVISRIASGKIAEEWENFDHYGLLQQLGVVPAP